MAEDEERFRRLTKLLQLKTLKYATVISQIRSIYDMAVRVCTDNSLSLIVHSFHAADLDSLWREFKSFDLAVLNYFFELNKADKCSHMLYTSLCVTSSTCPKPFGHKYVLRMRSSQHRRVLLVKHIRRPLSQFHVRRGLFAANALSCPAYIFRKRYCRPVRRRSKPFQSCPLQ